MVTELNLHIYVSNAPNTSTACYQEKKSNLKVTYQLLNFMCSKSLFLMDSFASLNLITVKMKETSSNSSSIPCLAGL